MPPWTGAAVRISDDYFIEAKKDEAPSVKIIRPGRDPHVSPIEEVPVRVEAADDFGLAGVDLHYSVNGGPEQVVPLSKAKGAKQAEGKTTLYFENFKLVPGDLVSFYATARDATKTSRSDIVFAQADPFDYQFRQSQQSGGGGMAAGGRRQRADFRTAERHYRRDLERSEAGPEESQRDGGRRQFPFATSGQAGRTGEDDGGADGQPRTGGGEPRISGIFEGDGLKLRKR